MGVMQLVRLADPEELPDSELAARACRRDEAAIRVLIRRHNRRLFRAARGVLGDEAEAEDVVQAAWVRAFAALESFRGEAALATWLTRIALNEALGRLRRRRPTTGLDRLDEGGAVMFPLSPVPPGPESEAGRARVRAVLERAVDGLPAPFRAVFVLREIEGMDTEETASLLDLRPETVKTRLHRARRQLRRALERELAPAFSEIFPFDGARCAGTADRVLESLRRQWRG
jgi:RNA polymerase sigma-70 factor (ECF subfamily)